MEEPIWKIGIVCVTENKMTFSGGPYMSTEVQTLNIHQTPDGTIYMDDKGSILTFVDAQKGEIEVMSGLGVKNKWKKQITTTLQSTFVDIPHGLSYGLDV